MSHKIVIAEDSPVDALVLRNVVQRAGYEPVIVDGGGAALDAIRADPEVRLLIADVQMPDLGGIELVTRLREDGRDDLAVIFVSSVADVETVRSAVGLKSSGYVLKPVREPSRILELIASAIGEPAVEA